MNKLMYSFGKLMYSFQPIDDFKIYGLLYSRPENSKWGEQNFQNGGFLYDFFINFRNFERIKMLDSRLKTFIKFKMNMKFQS